MHCSVSFTDRDTDSDSDTASFTDSNTDSDTAWRLMWTGLETNAVFLHCFCCKCMQPGSGREKELSQRLSVSGNINI